MNNREKAILMIQSNILIGGKEGLNPKDVFNSTRKLLKLLQVELDTTEYVKIFNDVLIFNDTDVEELSFQVENRQSYIVLFFIIPVDNTSTYSFLIGLVWGALGDETKDEVAIKKVINHVSDNLGIRLSPIEKEHIERDCYTLMVQSVKNMIRD